MAKLVYKKIYMVKILCSLSMLIPFASSFDSANRFYSFRNGDSRSQISQTPEKVDYIFNLLADIEDYPPRMPMRSTAIDSNRNIQKLNSAKSENRQPVPEISSTNNQQQKPQSNQQIQNATLSASTSQQTTERIHVVNKEENLIDSIDIIKKYTPATLKSYLKLAEAVNKNSILGSGIFDDIFKTVGKVTTMYDSALKKKINSSNSHTVKLDKKNQNGFFESTSKVINTLLKPENAIKIYAISSKADSEDEILEELVSVIMGAEDRSSGYGNSLTFDPVTIIALLTLAAYLIRAAYQFLVVAAARSMGGGGPQFPLQLSTMPFAFLAIQDMIAKAQNEYERDDDFDDYVDANIIDRRSPLTSWAVDAFSLVNLYRERSAPCFRKYLCQRVAGKSIWTFGIPEVLWTTIGVYLGDKDILEHLGPENVDEDFCQQFSKSSCERKGRNYQEVLQDVEDCQLCPPKIDEDMRKVKTFLTLLTSRDSFFYPWYQNWSLV